MATVTEATTVQYSGDYRVDSLLWLYANWNYKTPSQNVLYYTFTLDTEMYYHADGTNISAFNSNQVAATEAILAYAETVTGVDFVRVSNPDQADFHFANCNLWDPYTSGLCSNSFSYNYDASGNLTSYSAESYVFLDDQEFGATNLAAVAGTEGYETLLHEIGHALGLDHPFEGDHVLPVAEDNTNNTVMSYTTAGDYKSEFQAYDLMALQWIYGGDGLGGLYGLNSTYGPSLAPETTTPTSGDDRIRADDGNESIDGLGGVDTVIYTGDLGRYTVTLQGGNIQVTDGVGSGGTDLLSHVERLAFDDFEINLSVQQTANTIAAADLKLLEELYVAFFNRVPDANGLEYLVTRLAGGMSTDAIADAFYAAGIQASDLTGFSASMSNRDFVNVVYRNVLGRPEGADAEGLAYWSAALASGQETKGSLVKSILYSAHTFKGDPTWGWVADLLDNKALVADRVAVDWGVNYTTTDESISKGMEIAAAVTSTDTAAALALVGVDASQLVLV